MIYIPVLIIGILLYFVFIQKKSWKSPKLPFPTKWKIILTERVIFYNSLNKEQQENFEFEIQEFLLNHKIKGVDVTVDITDRILIAASAVIPIFNFPEWKYTNLTEILIYPSSFNENFETTGKNRNILGAVGNGYMNGIMILSKPAIHHGFSNESDKKNTAIHEFVHLIDKLDGNIDGVPHLLLEKQYAIPWIELIKQKMDAIYAEKSDINPYGGTNHAEFFAVISEYFFERPKLLSKKHPKLYELLEQIFKQKMKSKKLIKKKLVFGRNSLCPCDSGLKYKKCCAI